MTETQLEKIDLKNSLTLELYDGSRQVVADRWVVVLIARVEVPVDPAMADIPEVDWGKIKNALGDKLLFEQKRERNFIDAAAKDDVLNALCNTFKATQLPYLSHPEFAKRFILSRYGEHQKQVGRA
jgi:hypothetical protein